MKTSYCLKDFCKARECDIMGIICCLSLKSEEYKRMSEICKSDCREDGQDYYDWLVEKDCKFSPFNHEKIQAKPNETAYQYSERLKKECIELKVC